MKEALKEKMDKGMEMAKDGMEKAKEAVKPLMPRAAKLGSDIKAEIKPVGHSLAFILCWVLHVCLLPFVMIGDLIKKLSDKLNPHKLGCPVKCDEKKEEPVAE